MKVRKNVLAHCLPSLHTNLVPTLHLLRDALRQLLSFHELDRRRFKFLPSSFTQLAGLGFRGRGHTRMKKVVQVDVRIIILVNQVLGSDVRVQEGPDLRESVQCRFTLKQLFSFKRPRR
jgi:hypothetical protein